MTQEVWVVDVHYRGLSKSNSQLSRLIAESNLRYLGFKQFWGGMLYMTDDIKIVQEFLVLYMIDVLSDSISITRRKLLECDLPS